MIYGNPSLHDSLLSPQGSQTSERNSQVVSVVKCSDALSLLGQFCQHLVTFMSICHVKKHKPKATPSIVS